jgi:hypothetical protein
MLESFNDFWTESRTIPWLLSTATIYLQAIQLWANPWNKYGDSIIPIILM